MTRKDYVLIADALIAVIPASRGAESPDFYRTHRLIVWELTHRLAADNPRFDRDRFLKAAGVQS